MACKQVVIMQVRSDRLEQEQRSFKNAFQTDQLRFVDALTQPALMPELDRARALVIAGSPLCVNEYAQVTVELSFLLLEAHVRRLPVFGICYGAQLIAKTFRGCVSNNVVHAEYGTVNIQMRPGATDDPVFSSLPVQMDVQQGHGDFISLLPDRALWCAESAACPHQAFCFTDRPIYGVQFHPEISCEDYQLILNERLLQTPHEKVRIDCIRQSLKPTPDAVLVLRRFLEAYCS